MQQDLNMSTPVAEAPLSSPEPTNSHEKCTPSSSRDVVADGIHFTERKSVWPRPCRVHQPTLEELQKYSFSEYVRQVVLENARVKYEEETTATADGEEVIYIEDYEINKHGFPSRPPLYAEGMAKVRLPEGFWKEEGIGQDRTGRGPAWQEGSKLGDMIIPNPIKQVVRGIGGVYEYTLFDQPPIALHKFRDQADAYREQQLGNRWSQKKKKDDAEEKKDDKEKAESKLETNPEDTNTSRLEAAAGDDNSGDEPSIEEIERRFWKRLGPTMPPPTYGADMEGGLFGDDPATGWNVGQLESFLQLLGPSLPGVTSPYLYMGMWASVFAAHTEDMNLLSINYLHAGAPKVWYAIAPGKDAQRFEALCEHHFAHAHHECRQFMRHKRSLLSPMILKKAGIKYTTQVQYPGDAMITISGGYHFGFNTGFNVAEATNFGVPEWIPYGRQAKVCMCRPDSVRIDMMRLERLLARYRKECSKTTSRRRKSFREWGILHDEKYHQDNDSSDSESEEENDDNDKTTPSGSQKKTRKKEFWVEVMAPVPSSQRGVPRDDMKKKKSIPKKRKRSNNQQQREQQLQQQRELWRLAKPLTQKALQAGARVLVMIPGVVANPDDPRSSSSGSSDSDSDSEQEEDEQCFAGVITEFVDDYCRVHFERLTKEDDVWIHINSPKLFLDGGHWDVTHEIKGVPPRHYWQEMDSKRRCV